MWYQAHSAKPVKEPTRREKWMLRSLILLGLAGMGLFLHTIYQEEVIGYRPLYYLLIFSLTFLAFRIAYEWYHYFSISKTAEPHLEKDFTVDVLTTFCPGEPYEMILETLEAIQAIEYPHTTYRCDEANDPYLIDQCKRLGVVHVTRNNRQNAKAGNINNALRQATGEICLILDPDHVPAPDYLHRVLPYFQDPAVGFVQVVQAYKNINENIIAKGSAQQTFQFYGPMMMSMNSYGTAQAIGANCTFRRAALDSIGGHAPGLAEDMNTSMKLHAQGWKSRYVPLVLSRGLVPNTISAYYKQQLKWSRGVFELLVTTYRQNFSRFTLRQKIHYGLLPWHYFSGAIYLINFLVPILSLVLGLIPMKINLPYFFLMGMPFFASIYVVRHFVQRWVMEEDERGNHLVGGLLLIGTWYIHLLGFLFTLLRRKVPYDPTPKDNQEENILGPNLPNIAIALLSIAAIVYGLWLDYNPYSLFMAGFAALNCVFMGFILLISFQNRFRRFKAHRHQLARAVAVISFIKKQFWILRHRFLYRGLRLLALPLLLGLLGLLYYWGSQPTLQEIKPKAYPPPQKSHLLGWYLPGHEGRTHIPRALNLGTDLGFKPQIISSYLAWKPLKQQPFPKEHIDSIFAAQAYPLLTWEPWLAQFPLPDTSSLPAEDLRRITRGQLDEYLEKMAAHFAHFNKPIFVRFAHEPDNPQYPWHSKHPQAARHYRAAWRYLRRFFHAHGLEQLIWVYNPWKAAQADAYFPGAQQVDWLGITALNYGYAVDSSFDAPLHHLYEPFRRTRAFQQDLPVMLAEMGTLPSPSGEEKWFATAAKKLQTYPEIQACVWFGATHDLNLPPGKNGKPLNWYQQRSGLAKLISWSQNVSPPQSIPQANINTAREKSTQPFTLTSLVHYNKGQSWSASRHPLFLNTVREDFETIKSLGINTVLRYGPTVYDQNIKRAAREKKLNLHFGFWVKHQQSFTQNSSDLLLLRQEIFRQIEQAKRSSSHLAAWHLGNHLWSGLARRYAKPQLFQQYRAYLSWLHQVSSGIAQRDPKDRPITMELMYGPDLAYRLKLIRKHAPNIDAVGLQFPTDTLPPGLDSLRAHSPLPLYIQGLPAQSLKRAQALINKGWGIGLPAWQDDVRDKGIITEGLLDFEGRYKKAYRDFTGKYKPAAPPPHAILPTAAIPYSGRSLQYNALVYHNAQWHLAKQLPDSLPLSYHWFLEKRGPNDQVLGRSYLKSGPHLELKLPPQPGQYQLRLKIQKGQQVHSQCHPLAAPYYRGPKLREPTAKEADYRLQQSKK